MRDSAPFCFATILGTGLVLACNLAPACAQGAPGYWAGNVRLAQPANLPAMESEDAAPMPRPTSMPVSAPSRRVRQASYAEPVAAPITNQARQALNFYGGYSARTTLNQMPRRTPIQPAAVGHMPHDGKPFQSVTTTTTVSPYLNLFRDEDRETESAPNYYAFVRPQLEQQESLERQQRELSRRERQMQRGPAGGAQYQSSSGPARYMDTAQFYGGWKKK